MPGTDRQTACVTPTGGCLINFFSQYKQMDNEALSVSEDPPALSGYNALQGAGRKVMTFSRFLSRTEGKEDEKFKIQKKVCKTSFIMNK